MTTPAFGPGCPWFDLHSRFPPNIDWCEEKLCALVVTPFNTWTNLGYLVVAVAMGLLARRCTQPALRLFAPATLLTGLGSFIYHQSLNLFSQLLDFMGMYTFCVLLLMANLQRMGRWPAGGAALPSYGLAVVALTALSAASFQLGLPAQGYVAILILLIVGTELAQAARSRRFFWASVLTMALAAVLSALDLTRTGCDAGNHWLQLHGLWHLLSAAAIGLAFLHLRLAWNELPQAPRPRAAHDIHA
ncbi:MAG: ceramidase domain-containing protein [Rhodoferax sp.]|nr:ceramidase domain-containing protein [Rhodoferax sp.]